MTGAAGIAVAATPRLSDAALLEAWEAGAGHGPAGRALAVVGVAVPDAGPVALLRWPVGRRDAALLDVQARTFGSGLDAVTACPACEEPLELRFGIGELRAPFAEQDAERELRAGGHLVRFRAVSSEDLAAAEACGSTGAARAALVAGCVREAARDDGAPVEPAQLPPGVVDALDEALAEHDPQADLRLSLTCPECAHGWTARLDVGDFVWRQVEARAHDLLADVAALAAAYGWSEREVLPLSPARRRLYLELAGA